MYWQEQFKEDCMRFNSIFEFEMTIAKVNQNGKVQSCLQG